MTFTVKFSPCGHLQMPFRGYRGPLPGRGEYALCQQCFSDSGESHGGIWTAKDIRRSHRRIARVYDHEHPKAFRAVNIAKILREAQGGLF